MFQNPTRSKAIPIVKPPEEKHGEPKNGKNRPSGASLTPLHDVAIKQAVNAITSLTNGSTTANTVRVPKSNPALVPDPRQVPTHPVSVCGMDDKHVNPRIVTVSEEQKNRLTPMDDDDQDCEPGLNIYARPFNPEIFTIINTLPARQISTSPISMIDFDDYIRGSLGPAIGFLPQPLPLYSTNTDSTSTGTSIISAQQYEEYFQSHLYQEIQAQHVENNTYSRKRVPNMLSYFLGCAMADMGDSSVRS